MSNLTNAELVRAWTIAIAALIVIAGGMWMLYDLTKSGNIEGQAMLAIVSGLIGSVGTYLFTRDSNSQAVRASERATMAGASAVHAAIESGRVNTTGGGAPKP